MSRVNPDSRRGSPQNEQTQSESSESITAAFRDIYESIRQLEIKLSASVTASQASASRDSILPTYDKTTKSDRQKQASTNTGEDSSAMGPRPLYHEDNSYVEYNITCTIELQIDFLAELMRPI